MSIAHSSPSPDLEFKRRALGVDDALSDVPGVTPAVLAALSESGIKTMEDLAGCATDDLFGWTDYGEEPPLRHPGVLDGLGASRERCDRMIMHARVRLGWVEAR